VPEEPLEGLPDDPPEGRLLPADERGLAPDEWELPADGARGAEVRPELLRTEVDGALLGAPVVERLPPYDVEGRPEIDEPVGGTTTGLATDDRPELVLGAISCRLPVDGADGTEPVAGAPYMFGR
jgi:hypothetical protein